MNYPNEEEDDDDDTDTDDDDDDDDDNSGDDRSAGWVKDEVSLVSYVAFVLFCLGSTNSLSIIIQYFIILFIKTNKYTGRSHSNNR